MANARVNLFLLGRKYSVYVNKLIGTDLANKILRRESSLVLSNMCQTNRVSGQ